MKSNNKIITLNCGVQGCCPSIEFRKNDVFVNDDYGNRIHLSRKQWNLLREVNEAKEGK